MRCSNCNFENKEDANFCAKCGSKLISQTDNIKSNDSYSYKNIIIIGLAIILIITFIIVVFFKQSQTVLSSDELEKNLEMADEFIDEPNIEYEDEYIDSSDSTDEILIPYIDASNDFSVQDYTNYNNPSDFEIYSFDGYLFGYPKNFYNYAEKTDDGFIFWSNNGSFFNVEIIYRDNSGDLSQVMEKEYNHWKSMIYNPETVVYSDDESLDYRRFIISGFEDSSESLATYCLCNIYKDRVEFYKLVNYVEECSEEENNHANYILDTIYRMCSFSGTSYNPRNYQQFINGDMGSKK